MSTDVDSSYDIGKPTRTSTAIALVVTLGIVGVVLWTVDQLVLPAVVGSAGAVCFAVTLWLVSLERYETVTTVLASLLAVPIAVGLLAGTVGTVLLLVGSFFPVESSAALSLRSLLLLSRVGIVVGCVFAILGVGLGLRNVVDASTLDAYYWQTIKTLLVPGVLGSVLVAGTYLSRDGDGEPVLGAGLLDGVWTWVFAPETAQTHFATLLGLVAVATVSVRLAIEALPVAELLADSGAGETNEQRVSQVTSVLAWIPVGAVVAGVGLFAVEYAVEPSAVVDVAGPQVYDVLTAISTTPALRWLLVGATAVSIPTVVGILLLRRIARGSLSGFLNQVGPFVGGTLVTAGALVFAGPIVDGLVAWTADQLPGVFEEMFRETSGTLVEFFGASTIVVVLATVLVAVTGVLVLLFRLAVFAGYLSEATAGYSLASGGLFVAVAFAATIGAPPWLVFGGLIGSLLVWDTGRYGTTLGNEIGRHAPTRDAELVHAGGTLAVGLFGAAVAYAILSVFDSGAVGDSPTLVVALMGVLVGIVFLVAALR